MSQVWYHSIELPGGVVTPGEYDHRPILGRLPLPRSLVGKRCIDIGSRDGFFAFEMEKRGASEVVSVDLEEPADIQMPADSEASEDDVRAELERGNSAFETARESLGSTVRRDQLPAHRLSRDAHGEFDFGMIGTLLLHLRDPVGALTAIRGVIRGELLINDGIVVGPAAFSRRPVAELYMTRAPFWWMCNPAGLRRMAEAAGFRVVSSGRPYLVPYGKGPLTNKPGLRGPITRLPRRMIQRRGSLHAWVLASAS